MPSHNYTVNFRAGGRAVGAEDENKRDKGLKLLLPAAA
jgi:hypothetical protein